MAFGHNQVSNTMLYPEHCENGRHIVGRTAGVGVSGSSDVDDQRDLCGLHVNTVYQALLKWLRIQMRSAIWVLLHTSSPLFLKGNN